MAISYNKLWILLIDKKMTQAELRKAADIAPNTMAKLRRDEPVNLAILGRACAATVWCKSVLHSGDGYSNLESSCESYPPIQQSKNTELKRKCSLVNESPSKEKQLWT